MLIEISGRKKRETGGEGEWREINCTLLEFGNCVATLFLEPQGGKPEVSGKLGDRVWIEFKFAASG
jgi:hypothetical protein